MSKTGRTPMIGLAAVVSLALMQIEPGGLAEAQLAEVQPGAFAQAQPSPDIWPATAGDRASGRTIVIGFDGMDPQLAASWMADGTMPHFRELAQQGSFQPLATTNPAQSPVAWASFATGHNPGRHGLFDFLRRDPESYAPEYAIATSEPGAEWELFGWRLPITNAKLINRRVGKPFWTAAEEAGLPASVLRIPVTFPPDDVSRMLSGMGVPDLLGTQGTFTIYTTTPAAEGENARIVEVAARDGRVEASFEGPPHPLMQSPEPLTLPIAIERDSASSVRIELDGTSTTLAEGEWSDWVPIEFSVAWLIDVPAIVRFHLVSAFPDLRLYVSPINIDPRDPVQPISSPPGYAAELAERIGVYHTLGMPEETWSLNEGLISDSAWLEMVETVLAEREAMFFDALDRNDTDLVVAAFVQTDRVSHMFYRGLDESHPLHARTSDEARGAIRWIYGEADRILGETMERLGPDDRLIVLSDHGFNSFRRSVHLNRWLVENGYMVLQRGERTSGPGFANVDWTRTRAYAMGLNGIYLNRKGRERLGIVGDDEAGELAAELGEKLRAFVDPESGKPVIGSVATAAEIYEGDSAAGAPDLVVGYSEGYRASWATPLGGVPAGLVEDNLRNWSGDHCVDPALVPGILLTSFPLDRPVAGIADVPALIARTFRARKHD